MLINVDQIRKNQNFKQLFRWNLTFVKFPTAVTGFDSSRLYTQCESVDQPKMTFTNSETYLHGFKISQGGRPDYNAPLTFTFVESVDNYVMKFFAAWRLAMWDAKTGAAKNQNEIEAIIRLDHIDNKGTPLYFFELQGAFPDDTENGQMDGQNVDFMKPQLMLRYQYFTEGSY